MTAGPDSGRTHPRHDGDDESDDGVPVRPVTVVALPARASGRALPMLRRELLAGPDQPGGLVVDGSQVTHLSPAAQAVLVASRRTARLRGVAWRLAEPTDDLVLALRGSGLRHVLVPLPGRPDPPSRPEPSQAGPAQNAGWHRAPASAKELQATTTPQPMAFLAAPSTAQAGESSR